MGNSSCETLMLIPGEALGTELTEEESSQWVRYTHGCSIFTGLMEALGNRYSLVCVKPHLEPNLSSDTLFVKL